MSAKSPYFIILSAAKELHEGKPESAVRLLTSALKAGKEDLFSDAYANFVYALAVSGYFSDDVVFSASFA